MLSINLNLSVAGPSIGIKPLRGARVQHMVESALKVQNPYTPARSQPDGGDPLRFWNRAVEELTGLSKIRDIADAYSELLEHLDTFQFKGLLAHGDANLWIRELAQVRDEDNDLVLITDTSDSRASCTSSRLDKLIEEELCQ